MNVILAITKKEPKTTTLPDGNYIGSWGGYVIVVRHNNIEYELQTEEGLRGTGFKVMVTIKGDSMTFVDIKN